MSPARQHCSFIKMLGFSLCVETAVGHAVFTCIHESILFICVTATLSWHDSKTRCSQKHSTETATYSFPWAGLPLHFLLPCWSPSAPSSEESLYCLIWRATLSGVLNVVTICIPISCPIYRKTDAWTWSGRVDEGLCEKTVHQNRQAEQQEEEKNVS